MLILIDGFDHYDSATITKKWTSVANSPTINASGGRRATGALELSAWGSPTVSKTLVSNYATLIVGFALFASALPAATTELFSFIDASTTQCSVCINSSGQLLAYRGETTGTLLGTGSSAITAGAFNYIEVKITFNGTTGTFDIRKNAASILSLTAQNTLSTANAYSNAIRFGGVHGSGSATIDIDDFYLCDTSGSYNTNFLGDVRVDTLLPSADGSNSAWTPSTGTTHYTLVDEVPPNTSDYVSSSTVGNKDTYAFSNLGGTVTGILGTQVNAAVDKDDAGARSIAVTVKSSAVNADGATQALSTTQLIYSSIFETDPNTSAAWTQAGIDAAEYGVKLVV